MMRLKLITLILFLSLVCFGCKTTTKSNNATLVTAYSKVQILPYQSITWSWNPGGYSNFVVVCSSDVLVPLSQWATYTQTTDTNFTMYLDQPQRFFTLYGTNSDGKSAWVQK